MENKPHILLIMADQLRADCIGITGHPLIKTPNIDYLANQGILFENSYTTSPLCVPARISMTTGLYPHNSNLWQNDSTVPLDSDTYMHSLKESGYTTCSIGKNHLYPMENCNLYLNHPNYNLIGFDHIEDMSGTWGIIEGKSIYTDYLEHLDLKTNLSKYLKDLEDKPDLVRRFIAEPLPIESKHYIDSFIEQRVSKYVNEYDSDKPSFVYVGFQGPHEPWDAPEEYKKYPFDLIPDPIPEKSQGDWLSEESQKYQTYAQYYQPSHPDQLKEITAAYLGKTAMIDESIGQILKTYEQKGWLENTYVILSSDHGEMLGDLGRLSKSVFYESAIKIPMIIRIPETSDYKPLRGTTRQHFTELIDIHATLLDISGSQMWKHQDSISMLGQDKRNDVLSEVHVHYMLRSDEWKIVVGKNGNSLQLFDLQNDPLEQINLCGNEQYKTAELEMRSKLLNRLTKTTYRSGELDPELSSHFINHDDTENPHKL